MKRACIAIVDAAHARLYTYEQPDGTPTLNEVRDLFNPGRQAHGMFADAQYRAIGVSGRPGEFQAGGHGTVDDHREDHVAELETRFAKAVITEIAQIVREQGFGRVVFVASPRMLGTLRKTYGPLNGLEIDEIRQDLSWLTSAQLHDHLADLKQIRARHRAGSARSTGSQ